MAQEAEGYPGYQGYGGYGQAMDPASMRARLAMAMLQSGTDSSPIRSPWQGAARMSNALFGALMMRQMQDQRGQGFNDLRAGVPTGGGLAPGGAPGGSPSVQAPPNTLGNFAGNPAMVADVFKNLPPDTFDGGGGQMGPPMPGMAPNNSAGGTMIPGYMGGSSAPGGGSSGGPPPANMTAALPASMQHNMMVAGPGAPSQIPPLPPSGPASGNGPQGAGAGSPVPFNPSELAPFQRDVQGFAGTASPGGGGGGGAGAGGAYQAFLARGWSPSGAAGMAGNFGQESSFNPSIMGDGGTSGGMGQWHGPRFAALQNFAQQTGKDWRDPNVQYDFADREATAMGVKQAANAAPDATSAAGIVMNRYEQPAPRTANLQNRIAIANSVAGAGGGGASGPNGPPPSALAFNGGGGPPPASPATAAIQGAAGPPGGLNGPPASMQPNMMVAGPGVPSGARGGAPPPMPPQPPPNAGGGGNPLSALGNMFGMGNPSSPQGGSSPAPAGGGAATGGMNDPRAQKLWDVLANPYADPVAKQMAVQYLQYYGPHPTEWKTNPGTNDQQGYNPVTGQPIQGQFRPGPHETSVQKIGTDLLGQEQYGVFDKNTGQLVRRIDANGGDGGSAGAPPPSPTGSSVTPIPPGSPNSVPPGNIPPPNPAWTPGGQGLPPPPPAAGISAAPQAQAQYPTTKQWGDTLDQRQAGLVTNPPAGGFLSRMPVGLRPAILANSRAIVEGQQKAPVGAQAGAAKGINESTMEGVHALDPSWTENRLDTVKAFAEGSAPNTPGGLIGNARAGLRHLAGAAQASDLMSASQSNIPVLGPIMNRFANLGQQDYQSQYEAKIKLANEELTKYYLGAEGSKDERTEALMGQLNSATTPDARRSYIKGLADQLSDKLNVQQERWHAGVGGMPDYQLLTPQDQEHLAYIQNMGGRTGSGQGQPPGGNALPPPPGVAAGQWHAGGAFTNPIIPAPGGAQAAPAPPPQGASGGAPEVTEQQYNQLAPGSLYRVPGGSKVMKKP